MIKKYRKRPVEVQAVQITEDNENEIKSFCPNARIFYRDKKIYTILIGTPEGEMRGKPGDYIIKGLIGEFYPCKKEVFESSYEEC